MRQNRQSLRTKLLGTHLHLHEARTGQCFLEHFQCIIIIQNFNGVCECKQFFIASFANLGPFCLLCCTSFVKLSQKLLVINQCCFCVGQILFHLDNADTKLTDFCCFLLDSCGQCINFLCLCC